MLCALTVRRLKSGAFDDFRREWEKGDPPPGFTRAYTVRNVADPDEVISFGFFDGTLEDLRRAQQEFDYAGERSRTDEFVESTGADGIYEVVVELTAA